ncbi:hypothetical protein J4E85_002748 [Alternaria conjuncta]|uniref:uncharacterized protein n=1 Tax=Alternaria conjuncta TaxID=181017 RepID=UPI00221F176A|nr:uncharacterized protein J4E85_002748 [Alternaria conjuncta]KAI4934886.1 hypothetical protein J4E85_002748 [Alternaria conjuncta]
MAPNNNQMTEQVNSMVRILLAELNMHKDESARKDKEIERLTSELASLHADQERDKAIREVLHQGIKRKADDYDEDSARNVVRRQGSSNHSRLISDALELFNEAASAARSGKIPTSNFLQYVAPPKSSDVASTMPLEIPNLSVNASYLLPASLPSSPPASAHSPPPAEACQCNVDGHLKSAGHLPAEIKSMVEAIIPDNFDILTTDTCMRCRLKNKKMVLHRIARADVACLDCAKNKSLCVRKMKDVGAVLFPLCSTDRGDCDEQDEGFWVYRGAQDEIPSLTGENPEYPPGNSRKTGKKAANGSRASGRRR